MSILRRAEDALPPLLSAHSVTSSEASRQSRRLYSPDSILSHYFERRRVSDQLVEGADEVGEARPCRAVLLPTVQHELVQVGGAVWRRGQPVVLLYSIDHLGKRAEHVSLGRVMPIKVHISFVFVPCLYIKRSTFYNIKQTN